MKKFFLLLTLFLCTSMAWAQPVEVDGIYYWLRANHEASVASWTNHQELKGHINIPNSISVNRVPYSVTELSGGCFSGCTGITSVSIPSSITKYGAYCFSGCTGLTSIGIPYSVRELPLGFLKGCTNLTSVSLPYSVMSLGQSCFEGCTGL
ncbi:MAG: leucine-rich repeat domain-containing protein, partial [Alloprevotella sp.]